MKQRPTLHNTFQYTNPAPAGLFAELLTTARLRFYLTTERSELVNTSEKYINHLTLLNSFFANKMIINKIQQSNINFQLNLKSTLLNKTLYNITMKTQPYSVYITNNSGIKIKGPQFGSTVAQQPLGASTEARVVICTRPLFLWFVSFGGAKEMNISWGEKISLRYVKLLGKERLSNSLKTECKERVNTCEKDLNLFTILNKTPQPNTLNYAY